MKILALVASLVVIALLVAMGWQHRRYLRARRGPVQDHQPLLYGRSAFHVVSFVEAGPGADLLDLLRGLRRALEKTAGVRMVYAGAAAPVGIQSSQLDGTHWDAVVLVQYPSRGLYDELAATAAHREAFGRFARTYSHGMDRPVLLNLAIPMLLLGLRIHQIVTRQPSLYPLEPDPDPLSDPANREREERMGELDGLRRYSEDAVVIVNLLQHGTREQRAADRRYGLAMAGGFAEGAHGPMHMGRAVPLEGAARFDTVALVYYPGIEYMKQLMRSRFFHGIVGGKQPGDTLAVPTVPVLERL